MGVLHAELEFLPEPNARIGFLLLDTDHGSDREILSLTPHDVHVSIVRVKSYEDIELAECVAEIVRAAELIFPDAPVDGIGYACTSGSFGEVGRYLDRVRVDGRPRASIITTRNAIVAALEKMTISRVALLTPYAHDLNAVIEGDLKSRGVDVRSSQALGIESNDLIARLSSESIRGISGKMLASDAVQALIICCNALPVLSLIDDLEKAYDKPVITSNQALVWRLLRTSGYSGQIGKRGLLLRM